MREHQNNVNTNKALIAFLDNVITKVLAGFVIVIGLSIGGWKLYDVVDGKIKSLITANNKVLSFQIQKLGFDLAEMHYDDLSVRISVLTRLIKKLEKQVTTSNGITELDLKLQSYIFERDQLQDQLDDIKRKWLNQKP